MKQWLVGLVALTATAVQAGASVELFNGKDLSGWYKFLKGYGRDNDPQNVISVTNGVIRITGETWGALVTEKEYSDYRLDVEYRWTGRKWPSKANAALDSGILFHSTGPDGGFAGIWLFSHEFNVIYGATGDIWTVGSKKTRPDMFVKSTARRVTDGAKTTLVYDPKGEEVTLVGNNRLARCDIDPSWTDSPDAKAAVNENPIGEWNTATLICRGAAVECLFNGKLVNRATAVSPSRGKIQLQSEGCEIEYRRVTLTPLAAFISPAEKREGHTVASFHRDFRNAKAVRKATLAATATVIAPGGMTKECAGGVYEL